MLSRILMIGGVLVLVLPGMASAQQLFDFDGQTQVPALVGDPLSMVSIVRDPAPGTTPLPLDFANFEYTLVVTGLTYDGGVNPQSYSGGTIVLYEDAGTPADPNNPATYSDGTAILSGDVTTLTRIMFTGTLGSANGTVDWTGGTEIGSFAPSDRVGWTFVSGINVLNALAGYDEAWDGKVEPVGPVVETHHESFGETKRRF